MALKGRHGAITAQM